MKIIMKRISSFITLFLIVLLAVPCLAQPITVRADSQKDCSKLYKEAKNFSSNGKAASSDSRVAKVTKKGVITAKKKGTATITVTDFVAGIPCNNKSKMVLLLL